MSKLDAMKNLRGGVIYAAARVAPTTVQSWAVDLGRTKGPGYPRYEAADALTLVIMRQLTAEMMLAAGPAALIVNAIRPELPNVMEAVVAEHEASGHWRWDGGPFAIVRRKPLGNGAPVETWLTIIEGDDPGPAIADQRSGLTPLVIPLRRLINKTILALQLVLNGETPAETEAE